MLVTLDSCLQHESKVNNNNGDGAIVVKSQIEITTEQSVAILCTKLKLFLCAF